MLEECCSAEGAEPDTVSPRCKPHEPSPSDSTVSLVDPAPEPLEVMGRERTGRAETRQARGRTERQTDRQTSPPHPKRIDTPRKPDTERYLQHKEVPSDSEGNGSGVGIGVGPLGTSRWRTAEGACS